MASSREEWQHPAEEEGRGGGAVEEEDGIGGVGGPLDAGEEAEGGVAWVGGRDLEGRDSHSRGSDSSESEWGLGRRQTMQNIAQSRQRRLQAMILHYGQLGEDVRSG